MFVNTLEKKIFWKSQNTLYFPQIAILSEDWIFKKLSSISLHPFPSVSGLKRYLFHTISLASYIIFSCRSKRGWFFKTKKFINENRKFVSQKKLNITSYFILWCGKVATQVIWKVTYFTGKWRNQAKWYDFWRSIFCLSTSHHISCSIGEASSTRINKPIYPVEKKMITFKVLSAQVMFFSFNVNFCFITLLCFD